MECLSRITWQPLLESRARQAGPPYRHSIPRDRYGLIVHRRWPRGSLRRLIAGNHPPSSQTARRGLSTEPANLNTFPKLSVRISIICLPAASRIARPEASAFKSIRYPSEIPVSNFRRLQLARLRHAVMVVVGPEQRFAHSGLLASRSQNQILPSKFARHDVERMKPIAGDTGIRVIAEQLRPVVDGAIPVAIDRQEREIGPARRPWDPFPIPVPVDVKRYAVRGVGQVVFAAPDRRSCLRSDQSLLERGGRRSPRAARPAAHPEGAKCSRLGTGEADSFEAGQTIARRGPRHLDRGERSRRPGVYRIVSRRQVTDR